MRISEHLNITLNPAPSFLKPTFYIFLNLNSTKVDFVFKVLVTASEKCHFNNLILVYTDDPSFVPI